MCWSGQASFGMATLGIGGSLWARWKKESPLRWVTLLYFSSMELLQAFTYGVIGVCVITNNTWEGKANEVLTILSYLHICFQPIFTNLFGLSFSKSGDELKKWLKWSMPFIILFCLIMVSRLFFHDTFGKCYLNTPLCSDDICSYPGEWHIAWRLSLNGFDQWELFGFKISWLAYNLPVFILPLFYGGWRWTTYHFVFGIFLARQLTGNKDEFAAIWCLSSIAFLLATHIPFVHKWMETPLRNTKS